jgi:hypothetical protein
MLRRCPIAILILLPGAERSISDHTLDRANQFALIMALNGCRDRSHQPGGEMAADHRQYREQHRTASPS